MPSVIILGSTKGSSNMNVIPTNLNDLKEDIRHASPSRLKTYRLQLEAYTAYLAVYDGVQGSEEEKTHVANMILNDLYQLGIDKMGYYFDRDCVETAKTALEFGLREEYQGKTSKVVKLLPDISQLSSNSYERIIKMTAEARQKGYSVNPYIFYYLQRRSGEITLRGHLTLKTIWKFFKLECLILKEDITTLFKILFA